MNTSKKENGITADMDLSALDRELAQMAEETPEVPADFHEKWVRAIREDVSARNENRDQSNYTEEKRKPAVRRQLRYLLSAAAAFVVLIGGVIIAKNQIGKHGSETANSMTAEDHAIPMATSAVTSMPAILTDGLTAESVFDTEASWAAEEAEAPETDEVGPEAAADTGAISYGEAVTASGGMPVPAAGTAMKAETVREYEAAEASYAFTEEMPAEAEPMPAEATDTESAENAETIPETGTTGTETESRSFLQSVWSFLLTITPWVLGIVLAVLFIATYVVNIEKRRSRKNL